MLAVVFKCATFDDVTERGRHVPTTTGVGVGGRKGGTDVMAIIKWVHMACNGCIIGNRVKPGNQLVYNDIIFANMDNHLSTFTIDISISLVSDIQPFENRIVYVSGLE